LDVVFDAAAVGSAGDYSTNLTFSGDFGNPVDPAPLLMHVNEPPGTTLYLPVLFNDGNVSAGAVLSLGGIFLLPAIVILGLLTLRRQRR
ncbi:MAG: hypothetical protein L0346_00135, partial [Chloroflexi bacterium]|nr:hypothetical protein [Chloroflexota bacterium]